VGGALVSTALLVPDVPTLRRASDVFAEAISQDAVSVAVNPRKAVGVNYLSLGFVLDHNWRGYVDRSARRELARNANFKLVRLFDCKNDSPKPCTSWDEATKTGTFDWTDVDLLVARILEIDAEPFFTLGGYGSNGPRIPLGMTVDPETNLPKIESFAAYASRWVEHFQSRGFPVHYYEIIEEPWTYFGWDPVDSVRLGNYMRLFNATASSMRQKNHDISISFDFVGRKAVLDYWLANGGADVDSLNFHKYDDYVALGKTDAEMLARAESQYFGKWPLGYSLDEARQAWFNARGKILPVMNSETNFNSDWKNGTDPRIQQMTGAVWVALVLRMSILKGVRYNVYYTLSDSASYGKTTATGGAGFGMIESDKSRPWYPYYVHHMLGNNLSVGDQLVEASSSSDDVRTLAWMHKGRLNILLICKADQPRTLQINGLAANLHCLKIDNTIPWETPDIQVSTVDPTRPVTINGYIVALLQGPVP
jgi:hypothetical protein